MRLLAKVTIPVEKGDEATKGKALSRTMQSAIQRLKPEAAYFFEEDGKRECLFVFNLDMPSLLKPLFPNLDASFHVTPVMNAAEFEQGLGDEKGKQPLEQPLGDEKGKQPLKQGLGDAKGKEALVDDPDLLADISPVAKGTPEPQPVHGDWSVELLPFGPDDELAKKR